MFFMAFYCVVGVAIQESVYPAGIANPQLAVNPLSVMLIGATAMTLPPPLQFAVIGGPAASAAGQDLDVRHDEDPVG